MPKGISLDRVAPVPQVQMKERANTVKREGAVPSSMYDDIKLCVVDIKSPNNSLKVTDVCTLFNLGNALNEELGDTKIIRFIPDGNAVMVQLHIQDVRARASSPRCAAVANSLTTTSILPSSPRLQVAKLQSLNALFLGDSQK